MIRISEEHQIKIGQLITVLKAIPYGPELINKLFPPNVYHYAHIYNQLLKILSFLIDKRVCFYYQNLLSIRDNQINDLIFSYNINFDKYEINQKMKDINNEIFFQVSRLLQLLNRYST